MIRFGMLLLFARDFLRLLDQQPLDCIANVMIWFRFIYESYRFAYKVLDASAIHASCFHIQRRCWDRSFAMHMCVKANGQIPSIHFISFFFSSVQLVFFFFFYLSAFRMKYSVYTFLAFIFLCDFIITFSLIRLIAVTDTGGGAPLINGVNIISVHIFLTLCFRFLLCLFFWVCLINEILFHFALFFSVCITFTPSLSASSPSHNTVQFKQTKKQIHHKHIWNWIYIRDNLF